MPHTSIHGGLEDAARLGLERLWSWGCTLARGRGGPGQVACTGTVGCKGRAMGALRCASGGGGLGGSPGGLRQAWERAWVRQPHT